MSKSACVWVTSSPLDTVTFIIVFVRILRFGMSIVLYVVSVHCQVNAKRKIVIIIFDAFGSITEKNVLK